MCQEDSCAQPLLRPLRGSFEPHVTVVICTRNRPVFLRNCLQAIARLERAPDEVIVVDNTAGDINTEAVALEFAARYIVEPTQGLSRARNRGLTECNSEIIAYLDDDAVPDQRWLGLLLEPFADPDVAIVTGETISPESDAANRSQEPTRSFSNKNPHWFEIACFGGMGIGAGMALRKAACTGIKVFDERLGRGAPLHGAEEHHAFARLLSLGYRAVQVPAAFVVHPSIRRRSIEQEASCSIAYWLLLFFEFPDHRREVILFLFRRLRHKPLPWSRDTPGLGSMITSGWRMRIRAGLAGILLYLRARKMSAKPRIAQRQRN